LTTQTRTIDSSSNPWGWLLAFGILLIIAGVVALSSWVFAAVATSLVLGWLLIAGGAFQLIGAFMYRQYGGFWAELLFGALTALAGLLLVIWPVGGASVMAFVVVGLLLLKGLGGAVGAVLNRGPGWVLQLVLAVLLVLAAVLLFMNQGAALAFIGLLVGLSLLMRGVWWVFVALDMRKMS
jgi:uncharacterized membrane protein HdeD (DUF308 family)